MKTFPSITLAAALLTFAPAAIADTLVLDRPLAGGTLQGNDVDMSVYFSPAADNHSEIVAIYVDDAAPDQQRLITMSMSDGDEVHFSLPGHPETLYVFSRVGGVITIEDQLAGSINRTSQQRGTSMDQHQI
ncbi:hypothetical protein [Paracoccus alkanivorans]|uniref:hypothetical protein n=1 Tax=Paracoccus alkanivorans TaxID=2116655 RepID=UPI001AA02886|nr:hypothetical protein [Paracoccus alkanivorans]